MDTHSPNESLIDALSRLAFETDAEALKTDVVVPLLAAHGITAERYGSVGNAWQVARDAIQRQHGHRVDDPPGSMEMHMTVFIDPEAPAFRQFLVSHLGKDGISQATAKLHKLLRDAGGQANVVALAPALGLPKIATRCVATLAGLRLLRGDVVMES